MTFFVILVTNLFLTECMDIVRRNYFLINVVTAHSVRKMYFTAHRKEHSE